MRCISVTMLLLFVSAIELFSGSRKVLVNATNPADFRRRSETVEVSLAKLKAKAPWLNTSRIVVTQTGDSLPLVHQVYRNLLLFQSDFGPNESKSFTISLSERPSASNDSSIRAEYVLPRKDVAWENDMIAHRIYGGPLAGNVRSGVDVWVKRVRYSIIDKWYHGDSLKGKARVSYHVDHGEGADFFEVGRSLGAGGCALVLDGVQRQTTFFYDYRIAASGPVRTSFTVWYRSDTVGGKSFTEEKTYTLDRGSNLTRVDVAYRGIGRKTPASLAIGLVRRQGLLRSEDTAAVWMGAYGPTNSDSTTGELGTGIILPKARFAGISDDSLHFLVMARLSPERTISYYTGACWSKSGDFTSRDDWNACLAAGARKIASPLRVSIAAK